MHIALPAPTLPLPRAKPVPVAKPLTKWEKYAKQKGIQQRNKEKLVWNDEVKDWVPRWGFGAMNAAKRGKEGAVEGDWLVELKSGQDDPDQARQTTRKDKKDRIDKNKQRQRKNLEQAESASRGLNQELPRVQKQARKSVVTREIAVAKTSTASLGKFDARVPGEDQVKLTREKRKFAAVTGKHVEQETQRQLDILDKLQKDTPLGKKDKLVNVRKAVKITTSRG